VITVLVLMLAPIGGAYWLARAQGANDQKARAGLIADDVLRRVEETRAQVDAAFARLHAARRGDPCSDDMIRTMAAIDVASSQLQAVGYATHDSIVCSSLGRHPEGLGIGAPDFVAGGNLAIRVSRTLAQAPGVPVLIVTNTDDGFTALVHRDLPIDVFTNDRTVSVGVLQSSNRMRLLGRGDFSPAWVAASGSAVRTAFLTRTHVVAVSRSARRDLAAYAALPIAEVDAASGRTLVIVLPLGAAVGILLAWFAVQLLRQQAAMPAMIRLALKRREFFLEYQPIVDLRTGRWTGAEALLRWRRPQGETMRPDHFIPVAEDNGLIGLLTRRVLDLAREDAAGLFERDPHFHLALNLSADDLHSMRTVELLLELRRATGAGPGQIVVEATERGFMRTDFADAVMGALRANGFQLAIDDFGTGYSGLSYLQSFKVDYLKIDKTFVDTITTDAPTSHVVAHIIELAKALGIGRR
jgi:sensor c-di-GMP phosphodiesterase-like protein